MSNKHSDHTKPFTNLVDYLPEVFRSEVNQATFETSFNRHLTSDDTVRVAGYIGEKSSSALVDRQIKEATPHRQAYQLAPTMVAQVGTVETALSYKAFQSQLSLMGVNIDRLPLWANTTQFNWAPPINIDMLINYQDYFWSPLSAQDSAQYMTIENRCNKATSKVLSYQDLITQRGSTFSINLLQYLSNSFVVAGLQTDLFVAGFVFFTHSAEPNLSNKFWTVASSTYNIETNQTEIELIEPIAEVSDTAPVAVRVDQWWFDSTVNLLKRWDGSAWVLTTQQPVVSISLTELGQVYQTDATCACNQGYGWDIAQWDDNQVTPADVALWNTPMLDKISWPTEAAWIAENGVIDVGDASQFKVWYDTTYDELKEYQTLTGVWQVVVGNFSAVVAQTTGMARWDLTIGCEPQATTQWASQNQWIHKTEIPRHPDARRAEAPVLEYNSTTELNSWTKTNYAWKYRANTDASFSSNVSGPTRFELEPIKGYATTNINGSWYVYLHNVSSDINSNIDYTDSLIPGTQLRFSDDGVLSEVYVVASAEYREITSADPMSSIVGSDMMCTVVRLEGAVYNAPLVSGGPLNVRIQPVVTSSGDTWLGYHLHWVLDTANVTRVASSSAAVNLYTKRDNDSVIQPTPVPSRLPDYDSVTLGRTFQQFTVLTSGLTHVELEPQLQYGSTTGVYAAPGSGDVRVYVNGVRAIGTYREVPKVASPDYTSVGFAALTNIKIEYVNGVTFDYPLTQFDVVRIEVSPAAFSDMGLYSVPVRTIEDEQQFTEGVINGTQPVYISLASHQLIEQVKTDTNQYPLFNVYDVITGDVVKASPIFAYREDPSQPINQATQRRIVVSDSGRNFEFEQFLLDRDDNILYGYRALSSEQEFWFNPLTNIVQFWDGFSWSAQIQTQTSSGVVVALAQITRLDPSDGYTTDGAVWFNTANGKLYKRVASAWAEEPNVVINGADPRLRTVWRHSLSNKQYVPEYVDGNRQPIAQGSLSGDWELVDQWKLNPEHHNKQRITYTQLISHFRSILDGQPRIPGLLSGGVHTLAQDEIDFGVGGTIKEHNDSFDTLISAVNVLNTTPVGVVDFAARQYQAALTSIREIFTQLAPSFAVQYSRTALASINQFISDRVIDTYENNDFAAQVYGDTSAFDPITKVGIQNWPATAPMFALSAKYRPHMSVVGSTINLMHHDGHRSSVVFTPGELDRLAKASCNAPDARAGASGKMGLVRPIIPPATETMFVSAFATQLRVGVFWYHLGGGRRQLYKLAAYDIAAIAPSFFDTSGNQLRDGTMYYNTASHATFVKQGLAWIQLTQLGAGDISPLWQPVNFAELLGNVYLAIEQRLYDVTPDVDLAFDYASLQSEATTYSKLYEDRFMQFVADREITAPLVNVDYVGSNPFTWNYTSSVIQTPPRIGSTPLQAGSWQQLYTNCYGTPYPHLEPWKLQGYHDKPMWWDEQYLETVGSRRWKYDHSTQTGMWENIRTGVVPAGRTNPDGSISMGIVGSTPYYDYFSVNIGDNTILGGYPPDGLLPPYYDNTQVGGPASQTIRSVYADYAADISAPDADYAFGDGGPIEWEWTVSESYPYDFPVIAFQMQPVRMMHYMFGTEYALVDQLQVETTFKQVYSHEDALFHGDVYDTNITYTARGLNQWYVNLNRYNSFDTNGEFRQLWAGWDPKLTYQVAGIVDTGTIELANKHFDVIEQDYNVLLAKDGVIDDLWADSFDVSLLNIPPAIIQYNNQSQWRMELDISSSIARDVNYYGVKSYPFVANAATNEFTMFRYSMVSVSPAANRVIVSGDQTNVFKVDTTLSISESPGNNGIYTAAAVMFDASANQTRITVAQPLASDSPVGVVDVTGVVVGWNTGDTVVLSSSKFLPAPLQMNTAYFIIRTGPRTFKVAETASEAADGVYADIATAGIGDHTVSQLDSSFHVYGGNGNTAELWFHFVIDKTDIRTFTPPLVVNGMQTLINIVDGYAAYQRDAGLLTGIADSGDFDPLTGRMVDWSLETERFMDWAFGMRNSNIQINDVYATKLDTHAVTNINTSTSSIAVMASNWVAGTPVRLMSTSTLPAPLVEDQYYFLIATSTNGVYQLGSELSPLVPIELATSGSGIVTATTDRVLFTHMHPQWGNGTSIIINSSGVLPEPIIANSPYHIVLTGIPGAVRISTSPTSSDASSYIQFGTQGTGRMTMSRENARRSFPHFEMNPTRNNIWIDTPLGVLADVVQGPNSNIKVQQTIFDQYNRPISGDSITVYRQDRRSQIAIVPELTNDVDLAYANDPYNYIHIGGGHFFIEGYEHFLIFNDYTVGGALIYDPFLGLTTQRFDVDYFEKAEYTLRPTLGGFYLLDGKFYRNMEGATNDMRNYYDTFALSETSDVARRSRALLGYDGNMPFLDQLNTNEKTQFLFYKGMIETKGSINSVNAYINSRRFVDAKVDEFWALKVAEFGDARPRFYPRIKLFSTDGIATDVRMKFLSPTDDPLSEEVKAAARIGFKPISLATDNRWDAQPQQLAQIKSPLFFDGEVTSVVSIYIGSSIPAGAQATVTYFYNTNSNKLLQFDLEAGGWAIDVTADRVVVDTVAYGPSTRSVVYINHGVISDDVRVASKVPVPGSVTDYISTELMAAGTGLGQFTKVNAETISINQADFTGIIDIYPINPSVNRTNPAKLIDTLSSTVVSDLPIWHPAIGQHSHVAIHNVDLQSGGDPARYQVTLDNNPASQWHQNNPWNNAEIGTTWMDTSLMSYVPYYDTSVYSSMNDRLALWGNLQPWANVRVYQWVQSTVPPSQWGAAVIAQQNSTVAQNEKATGSAKMASFRRNRKQTAVTLNSTSNTIEMNPMTLADGDQVLLTADVYPASGIEQGVKYVVTNIVGNTCQIISPATEQLITFSDNGVNVYLTPAFTVLDWSKQSLVSDRLTGAFAAYNARVLAQVSTPIEWEGGYTLPVNGFGWTPTNPDVWTVAPAPLGDTVDIYINGVLRDTQAPVTIDSVSGLYVASVTGPIIIQQSDVVDIVRPEKIPTPAELSFNPDVEDDGTTMIQWTRDYEYTTRTITGGSSTSNQTPSTYYYFWVENSTNRRPGNSGLSVQECAIQIAQIPTAHMVMQTPKDDTEHTYPDPYNVTSDADYSSPIFYRDVIVRKIAHFLADNDRFVVQFTRDLSLRDDLEANGRQVNLKNKHQEWVMFRENQPGSIDRKLWDALTESMAGCKLTNPTILVPNPTRVLYDARNNTDTRFGLGVDQAFVDRALALATIQSYLRTPSNDFTPTDINAFLARYKFDTPANIIETMNAIYLSFTSDHVNAMWFETLADALSMKAEYAELLKTSWIAIHGVRILEVGGLFD